MSENFLLERHTEMWETQNLRVKRMIIASLILGFLLLMNVLRPYAFDLDQRKKLTAEIENFKQEKIKIETSIKNLEDFKKALSIVQVIIQRQPWMREKDKLVRTLAEINNRGEGSWPRYQKEADSTIRTIGAQVNMMVATPLNEYLLNNSQAAQIMPGLLAQVEKLPTNIENWVTANLGKRWYRTLESKGERVDSLSRSLNRDLQAIDRKIDQEQPNLLKKKNDLNQKIIQLEDESNIKAKKELLKALEAKMDKILPEWVRGLISVDQMIQFYPVLILCCVIYVMGISLSLRFHFRSMARLRNIMEFAKKNPIFSSLWTLTFRGKTGTILTISTYLGFLIIMCVMFEMGIDILEVWMREEGDGLIKGEHLTIIKWSGRLIITVLSGLAAILPFYQKNTVLP